MLRAFLDFYRATLCRQAEGLTAEQLSVTLAPSDLTLGGLLKHMALVEESWFEEVLRGHALGEPWASADWEADRDWDLHSAGSDSPEELRALLDRAVASGNRIIDEAISTDGLDTRSVRPSRRTGEAFTLRWILVHMIEEYARHTGHADLIRESIDGATDL